MILPERYKQFKQQENAVLSDLVKYFCESYVWIEYAYEHHIIAIRGNEADGFHISTSKDGVLLEQLETCRSLQDVWGTIKKWIDRNELRIMLG